MAIDSRTLEPAAVASQASGEAYALFSIAISMKRIADAVCGDDQNTGIHKAILDIADLANIPR